MSSSVSFVNARFDDQIRLMKKQKLKITIVLEINEINPFPLPTESAFIFLNWYLLSHNLTIQKSV